MRIKTQKRNLQPVSGPTRAVIVGAVVMGACSRPAPKPDVGNQVLALGPLSLTWNGFTIARLYPDGRTEEAVAGSGKFVRGPTLCANGNIELPKTGFTAKVETDGTIRVQGPGLGNGAVFGSVKNDELRRTGSDEWIARVDRDTVRWNGQTDPNQIVGLTKPEYARTVLVWLASSYIEMSIQNCDEATRTEATLLVEVIRKDAPSDTDRVRLEAARQGTEDACRLR